MPLIVWRKELRIDSGGAGRTRGGLGLSIEVGNSVDQPFTLRTIYERIDHPARGAGGGRDGAAGSVSLSDGTLLSGKGMHQVPAGMRATLQTPGGGGYGRPAERSRQAIAQDLEFERISPSFAHEVYGVDVTNLDERATGGRDQTET